MFPTNYHDGAIIRDGHLYSELVRTLQLHCDSLYIAASAGAGTGTASAAALNIGKACGIKCSVFRAAIGTNVNGICKHAASRLAVFSAVVEENSTSRGEGAIERSYAGGVQESLAGDTGSADRGVDARRAAGHGSRYDLTDIDVKRLRRVTVASLEHNVDLVSLAEREWEGGGEVEESGGADSESGRLHFEWWYEKTKV